MKNIKDLYKQKELKKLKLQQEHKVLQNEMADPKSLEAKLKRINHIEKELDVINSLVQSSIENKNDSIFENLKELREYYNEKMYFTENSTKLFNAEKSKLLNDLDEKPKIVKKLTKMEQKTMEKEISHDYSFLDDVD